MIVDGNNRKSLGQSTRSPHRIKIKILNQAPRWGAQVVSVKRRLVDIPMSDETRRNINDPASNGGPTRDKNITLKTKIYPNKAKWEGQDGGQDRDPSRKNC